MKVQKKGFPRKVFLVKAIAQCFKACRIYKAENSKEFIPVSVFINQLREFESSKTPIWDGEFYLSDEDSKRFPVVALVLRTFKRAWLAGVFDVYDTKKYDPNSVIPKGSKLPSKMWMTLKFYSKADDFFKK